MTLKLNGVDPVIAALAAQLDAETSSQSTVLYRYGDDMRHCKAITLDELEEEIGEIEQIGSIGHKAIDTDDEIQVPIYRQKDAEADKKAAMDRSKKYGIALKEGGSLTVPKKWRDAGATDSDFADPVNYSYYLGTEGNARNALSRWQANKDVYTPDEQKVIEERMLAAAKKYGIDAASLDDSKDKNKGEKATGTANNKPDLVECPKQGCNGKVPVGSEKCPNCGSKLTWNDDQPSLADKTGEKEALTLEDGTVLAVLHEKDAIIHSAVNGATDDNITTYAVIVDDEEYNIRVEKSVPTKRVGELARMVARVATKDWDDVDMDSYSSLSDPDDEIWRQFDNMWDSTLDAIDGMDDVSLAGGGAGISRDDLQKILQQQMDACLAIFDARAGAMGATGSKDATIALMKAIRVKAPALASIYREKAGKRHSASDQAELANMHGSLKKLGYDGCMPAVGGAKHAQGVRIKEVGADDVVPRSELHQATERAVLIESDLTREKEVNQSLTAQLAEKDVELDRLRGAKAAKTALPDPRGQNQPAAQRDAARITAGEHMDTSDYVASLGIGSTR